MQQRSGVRPCAVPRCECRTCGPIFRAAGISLVSAVLGVFSARHGGQVLGTVMFVA
ncbi:hypothetical protein IG631_19168 [Alternaria alternata]|nr:hypothetical protein IG631_19168 [Alternaria alternata]